MLTPPLRVAVLCSRRAPGLSHLLMQEFRSPAWRIVCCLTSEDTFDELPIAALHDVAVIQHPAHRFYMRTDPHARFGDLTIRAKYDARTAELLAPYTPDLILLAGYLLLLTEPMLSAFGGRIVNVHHSDLLLRTASGEPRYPGLRAVGDAIMAGERELRCTSHLVTSHLDDGPMLLRSNAYPVPALARWAMRVGAEDVLRKVIWAQQEWMLRSAFGPLMERTLDLLAAGEPAPSDRVSHLGTGEQRIGAGFSRPGECRA
jgi:folate-dependent phosphoribosylglycinamide formyltransferase PurN